jgi:hypothetical protein
VIARLDFLSFDYIGPMSGTLGKASHLISSIARIPLPLSWPEGKARRLTYPNGQASRLTSSTLTFNYPILSIWILHRRRKRLKTFHAIALLSLVY